MTDDGRNSDRTRGPSPWATIVMSLGFLSQFTHSMKAPPQGVPGKTAGGQVTSEALHCCWRGARRDTGGLTRLARHAMLASGGAQRRPKAARHDKPGIMAAILASSTLDKDIESRAATPVPKPGATRWTAASDA